MRKLIVAAVMAVLSAAPALANVSCWAELSAGKNVTATHGEDINGPVTIAADGLAGGVGLGCDVALAISAAEGFGTPIIGAMVRYDWADISQSSLSTDGMWMVAGRAGIKINPSTLVYGLAGIAGTELSFPGLSDDTTGILLGAGLEVDIAVRNLSLIFEYNHIDWKAGHSDDNLTSLRPDTDVFRVGARLKLDFNGMLQGK